jgi:hypothetical protein
MMAFVIAMLLGQGAPLESIVEAWRGHVSSHASSDVEIRIVRDSRRADFGAGVTNEPAIARLRFHEQRRRLDVPRLTVVRRDGRTAPAEIDPERARVEFRNVLLEERLAGPQVVPRIQEVTLFIDERGAEHGQRLSVLDRWLVECPLWSIRTELLADMTDLEAAPLGDSAGNAPPLRLTSGTAERSMDLWVENAAPYRVLRVIGRERGRSTMQADLTYNSTALIPSRCVVQMLAATGEPLAFVETIVEARPLNDPASVTPPDPETRTTDDPVPVDRRAVRSRRLARQIMDSPFLPAAVVVVAGTVMLFRRRRPA